jgi:hypothetical protein
LFKANIRPPTPFFNILIENVNDTELPNDAEQDPMNGQDVNDSALVQLIEKDITKLNETFPEFDIIEFGRTLFLSDIPAYRMIYTFTDPGPPFYLMYGSMRVWAMKEDKVYNISYTANKKAFPNYICVVYYLHLFDSI